MVSFALQIKFEFAAGVRKRRSPGQPREPRRRARVQRAAAVQRAGRRRPGERAAVRRGGPPGQLHAHGAEGGPQTSGGGR